MLKKRFNTYQINEYNTSKMHHKTHEKMENIKVNLKGESIKLHAVLTFKMSNNRMGCINRDLNAVINFKNIVESLIETKKRPLYLSKEINSVNLSSKRRQITERPSANKHKHACNINKRVQVGIFKIKSKKVIIAVN